MKTHSRWILPVVALAALVTGCSAPSTPTPAEPLPASREPSRTSDIEEVAAHQQRLALTYDGGILVLDADGGELVADLRLEGFNRLNDASDGRHVLVSTAGGFRALDLGTWTDQHGSHGHSFVSEPAWTDTTIPAGIPGHVVAHGNRTTLFDDATGAIVSLDPRDLGSGRPPELRHWDSGNAHHGVAVELPDGTLLRTVADGEERQGVVHATAAGQELARSVECPGLHGEAFAGEVAVFGCEDGVLLFGADGFDKIPAGVDYARSGNLAGHADSEVVLADYKTDPAADLERPTTIALFSTATSTVQLVDLGTSYSFRSLGRGPDGEALVLGADGILHTIDDLTGQVTDQIPVLAEWEEPLDWRQPRPTLEVVGERAFVTDPAASALHVVDLTAGKVVATHQLEQVPNEVVGPAGY